MTEGSVFYGPEDLSGPKLLFFIRDCYTFIMLQKNLDRLRERPRKEHHTIALFVAGGITLILFLGWASYYFSHVGVGLGTDARVVNESSANAQAASVSSALEEEPAVQVPSAPGDAMSKKIDALLLEAQGNGEFMVDGKKVDLQEGGLSEKQGVE